MQGKGTKLKERQKKGGGGGEHEEKTRLWGGAGEGYTKVNVNQKLE